MESIEEKLRRLGDELRDLTHGEHYFIGIQKDPKLYQFSFGSFRSPVVALEQLIIRINQARTNKHVVLELQGLIKEYERMLEEHGPLGPRPKIGEEDS